MDKVRECIQWLIRGSKEMNESWGHGSAVKVPAPQAWGPMFDPQQPHKKPGVVARAYNPRAGEVEAERSQEFTDQHVLLKQWTSGSVRTQA